MTYQGVSDVLSEAIETLIQACFDQDSYESVVELERIVRAEASALASRCAEADAALAKIRDALDKRGFDDLSRFYLFAAVENALDRRAIQLREAEARCAEAERDRDEAVRLIESAQEAAAASGPTAIEEVLAVYMEMRTFFGVGFSTEVVDEVRRVEKAEARCTELEAALAAYERAVESALQIAPNHWQRYRDPFELGEDIRKARALARATLAPAVDQDGGNPKHSLGETREAQAEVGEVDARLSSPAAEPFEFTRRPGFAGTPAVETEPTCPDCGGTEAEHGPRQPDRGARRSCRAPEATKGESA